MEGNPIERISNRRESETRNSDLLSVENLDKSKKEKIENIKKMMEEKSMEKVHVAYALLNSELPFDHDFIQGYFTGDTDYFLESRYRPENLEFLEQVIDGFDPERDKGKMFPTSN